MNRQERRIARSLGVEWVGVLSGDWIEVCLGGPGCGCGDASRERSARAEPEHRTPGSSLYRSGAPEKP